MRVPQAYRGFGQPIQVYQGFGSYGGRYRSRRTHMTGYGQEASGVGVECIGDPPGPGWTCEQFLVDERWDTVEEAEAASTTIFEHLLETGMYVREHTVLSSTNVVKADDGWTVMVRFWASPEAVAEEQERKKEEWWDKYKAWVIGGSIIGGLAIVGGVWYFTR